MGTLFSEEIKDLILFFLAVFLHEGGHLLAILFFGERPKELRFRLGGAEIRLDNPYLSYRKEVLIHLAGPLAGAFTSGICILILRTHPYPRLFYFLFCNLFLTALNALPIKGLDGYHALFSLLCIKKEEEEAKRILLPYHGAFSLILLFAGLFLLFSFSNPTLILFQILLTKKEKATKNLVA